MGINRENKVREIRAKPTTNNGRAAQRVEYPSRVTGNGPAYGHNNHNKFMIFQRQNTKTQLSHATEPFINFQM